MTPRLEAARLILEPDGRIADATEEAQRLLGASVDELRAAVAGAFSPEPPDEDAAAAFRQAWTESGAGPIAGRATVRRVDGELRRVRYLIVPRSDERFEVVLEPIDESATKRPTAIVLGEVLATWREAERRLERLVPGSAEARAVATEVDRLRQQYQELFRIRRSASPD
jgi:PAS domain-containing protein